MEEWRLEAMIKNYSETPTEVKKYILKYIYIYIIRSIYWTTCKVRKHNNSCMQPLLWSLLI